MNIIRTLKFVYKLITKW